MAKLNVRGKSEIKVKADTMIISITLNGGAYNINDAVSECQEQCERFLSRLEECGIKSDSVILEEERIRKTSKDDRPYMRVKKSIQLKAVANIELNSYVS